MRDFDPPTDRVVLGPHDDTVEYGQNPEAFGWGVQAAAEVRRNLRRAVRDMLGGYWIAQLAPLLHDGTAMKEVAMKCSACGRMNCSCDKGGKCNCPKDCACAKTKARAK